MRHEELWEMFKSYLSNEEKEFAEFACANGQEYERKRWEQLLGKEHQEEIIKVLLNKQ